MPVRSVRVTAPSRLHFGLFAFGETPARQYGGVGVMVAHPSVRLRVTAFDRLQVLGQCARRVQSAAASWARWHGGTPDLGCQIEVQAVPRLHSGLGVGTQLALAPAAALNAAFCRPPMSAVDLAQSVARGKRSAVGTHGFLHGGLIVEGGKLPGETLSVLEAHLPLPAAWRFLLIDAAPQTGLHGRREEQAFGKCPLIPVEVTARLRGEVHQRMLPALQRNDYNAFAESVYCFSTQAGECFAPVQGGTYANPRLARIVSRLRDEGVAAVGQSSWGPTLFVLQPDQSAADELFEKLRHWDELRGAHLAVTPASAAGATTVVEPEESRGSLT